MGKLIIHFILNEGFTVFFRPGSLIFLPNGHQFPQSGAHTTIMLHVHPCTHIIYSYNFFF